MSTARSSSSNAFELRDASDRPVTLASVRVPAGRQNVVELSTPQPLAAGSYQLAVLGDGPAPLADEAGRVLDGDVDGKPGGDMLIPFDVKARRKLPMNRVKNLVRLAAAVALFAAAGAAQAEPYLAAQMGLKCVQCHVNPTGGGMRTVFGNTFAQTPLAAKRLGSEEDLWTGQVMKFLSVGGNARANYNYTDVPDQDSTNDFAVEEARVYLDFGVIPNRLSVYIDQRFAPGNSTNLEANIRYWITENSIYVKAGRMYLPFGYRFEDDNAFVRQLSGINMQAPDEGVEFGFETGSWSTQFALSNGTAGAPEVDEGKQITARTEYAGSVWRVGVSALSNDTDAGDRIRRGSLRRISAGTRHAARRGRLLRRRQHRRRGAQAHGLARRGRLESAPGPQPQGHVRVARAR